MSKRIKVIDGIRYHADRPDSCLACCYKDLPEKRFKIGIKVFFYLNSERKNAIIKSELTEQVA